MSTLANDRRAVLLLTALILIGVGLLSIPLFLTPPAYLDLILRDVVFDADLSTAKVVVTDQKSGKTISAAIRKLGNAFVANIGRINSGTSTYTAQVTGYKPGTARVHAPALQHVRAPVELQPTFGRLEVSPVNATRRDEPIAATVRNGSQAVTREPQRTITLDLPAGRHRIAADASGYCRAEREFDVRAGKVTRAVLPLSPDLRDDEVARFVLGWRNEPRDLDSHFRASDAIGFPHRAHLYWAQKTATDRDGTVVARLDVDELYPGRYETVTVRANATGSHRYFVHLFSGIGTIADAEASVQVYTRGCQMRTFTPPSGCRETIWNVLELRHDQGTIDLVDTQTCEAATGPRVVKR